MVSLMNGVGVLSIITIATASLSSVVVLVSRTLGSAGKSKIINYYVVLVTAINQQTATALRLLIDRFSDLLSNQHIRVFFNKRTCGLR